MQNKPKIFLVVAIITAYPIFAVAEAMTSYEANSLSAGAKFGDMYDLQLLKQAARKGDPSAEYWLGSYYGSDSAKSIEWIRKSAKQGDASAEGTIAQDYQEGIGVPENYKKAITWARKGASGKSFEAASCLSDAYFMGEGVPKNNSRSNYWDDKASEFATARNNKQAIEENQYDKLENSKPANPELNVFLKMSHKDEHKEAKLLAQEAYHWRQTDALQRLKVGAKSGVTSAEDWLGSYYETEKHYIKANYWYKKAAVQGDARAKKYLKTYAHIQYEQRDDNSGSFQSLSEAQQHNAYAMTSTEAKQLEKAASNGNTTDLSKLAAAAKSGDAKAQLALGFYWFTKKDYATSNQWWKKAATQGNVKAETGLGLDRTLGLGAPKDYVRANYWFEKAASQGSANAEFNLGLAYFHGYGVPKNYAKANYWYRKASAQGFALAENNLGLAYLHGYGVPQNYSNAVYWYEKAAAQGNAAAENNLGVALYRGHGVPQNTMAAISWWKKAAAQGGRVGMMAQHAISMAERG